MKTTLFSELGLSAELLKAIDKLGFEQASPIQAEAIPVLLRGVDVVGQSQTGSGKTAAFAAPAIEKVDPLSRAIQVLVLCPTRELAIQVSEEVHKLALFKRGIHALPIYGGQSYERQFYGLKQGAQIVIGTPGRLMDHMQRGTLRLDTVKMVILDEADVMLDMGFRDDIEFILQKVPTERQTVFFSATLPRGIQDLIQRYSRDAQSVRIEQQARTVPTVEQVYYEVDRRFKIELLTRLIDIHDLKLGIIFCNTKAMVDDLVDHLEAQGYSADRLHGGMTQAMRDRVMNRFRRSGLEFLVATDVAARGIDVDDVQVVFNYDLPYDPEDYLHRIGRTGRAGRSGQAISFVSGRELFQIQQIERFTRVRIQRGRPPTRNEAEEARANVFLDKLRATLQSGEYQRQDHLIERLLEEGFSSTDIASAMLHYLQGGEAPPAAKPAPRAGLASGANAAPTSVSPGPAERPPLPRPDLPPRPRPATPAKPAGGATPVPTRASQPPASAVPVRPPLTNAAAKPAVPAPETVKPLATPPPMDRPLVAEEASRKHDAGIPSAARLEGAAAPTPAAGIPAPFKSAVPRTLRPAVTPQPRGEREEVTKVPTATKRVPMATPVPARKPSRRTPGEFTRLFMNIGTEMGLTPGDVVGAILGETGLPPQVVGVVDIRERHVFVDVAAEHANGIIAKLSRTQIRGRRVKIKTA